VGGSLPFTNRRAVEPPAGLWPCAVSMRPFVPRRSISLPLLKVLDPCLVVPLGWQHRHLLALNTSLNCAAYSFLHFRLTTLRQLRVTLRYFTRRYTSISRLGWCGCVILKLSSKYACLVPVRVCHRELRFA